MKTKFTLAFLTCTLLCLTACGNDSSSRSSSSGALGGAYQGRWKGACEVLSSVSSRVMTLTINNDGTLQIQFEVYANNQCSVLASTEVLKGSFTLGGANINVKDANDFSFELTSSTITPEALAIASFNSNSICQKNNWAAGVPANFSVPNSCSSAPIFKGTTVIGLVGGQLHFGNSTGTALDMTESFVKQ